LKKIRNVGPTFSKTFDIKTWWKLEKKNTVRWAFGKDERLGNATNWKCLLTEVPTNRNMWEKEPWMRQKPNIQQFEDISNRNIWNIPPGTPKFKYERISV